MDEDILALVSDEVHQPEKLWDLLDLQVGIKTYKRTTRLVMLGFGLLSSAACLRSLLAAAPVIMSIF